MSQRPRSAAPVPSRRDGTLLLARAGWTLVAALAIGVFVLSLPARWGLVTSLDLTGYVTIERADLPLDTYLGIILAQQIALAVGFCAVGAVIAWRKWDDRFSLFASLTLILFGTHNEWTAPTTDPAWGPIMLALALGAFGSLVTFLFLFPDGRFVPRWTWLLIVPLVVPLTVAWDLPKASPFSVANWPPILFIPVFFIAWGLPLYAQVFRYRRVSDPVQRRQTKWVVLGVVAMIVIFLVNALVRQLSEEIARPGTIGYLLISAVDTVAFLCIPLSIGVAILRANLFDIDVIIRRTAVYGVLTAALLAIYLGGVVLLQGVFRALAGQDSDLAIVAATLAVAALFLPLRGWVQAFIDRRFYRRRYDAAAILAAHSGALRDEVDIERLTATLLHAADETMQPAHTSLWLRAPEAR